MFLEETYCAYCEMTDRECRALEECPRGLDYGIIDDELGCPSCNEPVCICDDLTDRYFDHLNEEL